LSENKSLKSTNVETVNMSSDHSKDLCFAINAKYFSLFLEPASSMSFAPAVALHYVDSVTTTII